MFSFCGIARGEIKLKTRKAAQFGDWFSNSITAQYLFRTCRRKFHLIISRWAYYMQDRPDETSTMKCGVPEGQISDPTFGIPSVPITFAVSITEPLAWTLSIYELTVNAIYVYIYYNFICKEKFVLKEVIEAYGEVKEWLHKFLNVALVGKE
jgi:hypothetical protein